MKKSTISFEDFLEKLSEVRFSLEVDGHVRSEGREKTGPLPRKAGGSKTLKKDSHPGGTGSGRSSNELSSLSCKEINEGSPHPTDRRIMMISLMPMDANVKLRNGDWQR